MKKAILFPLAAALLLCSSLRAEQTAYEALRLIKDKRGDDSIQRVLIMRGEHGATQPPVWEVAVEDPTARSGVRHFEVTQNGIAAERTPRRDEFPPQPIDLRRMNLDSDGAFLVANEQARDAKIGFDSANYLLQMNAEGEPVWTLDLLDIEEDLLATVKISAEDGNLITMRRENGDDDDDHDYETPEEYRDTEDDGFLGRTRDRLERAARTTEKGVLKAAGSIQEWLTGRRTIDRKYQEE